MAREETLVLPSLQKSLVRCAGAVNPFDVVDALLLGCWDQGYRRHSRNIERTGGGGRSPEGQIYPGLPGCRTVQG